MVLALDHDNVALLGIKTKMITFETIRGWLSPSSAYCDKELPGAYSKLDKSNTNGTSYKFRERCLSLWSLAVPVIALHYFFPLKPNFFHYIALPIVYCVVLVIIGIAWTLKQKFLLVVVGPLLFWFASSAHFTFHPAIQAQPGSMTNLVDVVLLGTQKFQKRLDRLKPALEANGMADFTTFYGRSYLKNPANVQEVMTHFNLTYDYDEPRFYKNNNVKFLQYILGYREALEFIEKGNFQKEYVLTFEDDAVVPPSFRSRVEQILPPSDFDVVFLSNLNMAAVACNLLGGAMYGAQGVLMKKSVVATILDETTLPKLVQLFSDGYRKREFHPELLIDMMLLKLCKYEILKCTCYPIVDELELPSDGESILHDS